MSVSNSTPIPMDILIEGFEFSIENAIRIASAAHSLIPDCPDKALALAQIGQEEIGKSVTILAASQLPAHGRDWSWFWKSWKGHALKAHRAYLYEWIHPIRIEITSPEGKKHDGLPLYSPITKEKELGLYVDFDPSSGRFVAPNNEVSVFDAVARITTVCYLASTADAVRRALLIGNSQFRFREFGSIAFRLCTEKIRQQDMPKIIDQFKTKSKRHTELIRDLNIALCSVSDMLEKASGKPIKKV